MPPLHEALVEVHKEYVKARRAAKHMAKMYNKATIAAEILNKQCTASQAENHKLSEQIRGTEEIMKKINEEAVRRPDESVQEWQQNANRPKKHLS